MLQQGQIGQCLELLDKLEIRSNAEGRRQLEHKMRQGQWTTISFLVSIDKESEEISMLLPSLALAMGQGQFFDILINACPEVLFMTTSCGGAVDTPLKCAINMRSKDMVNIVLRNEHFIAHEFNHPEAHLAHINACMQHAEKIRSPEITRMLRYVVEVRMPIILAMHNNELGNLNAMLIGAVFNPEVRNVIVKDCIAFARKSCNEPNLLRLLEDSSQLTENART